MDQSRQLQVAASHRLPVVRVPVRPAIASGIFARATLALVETRGTWNAERSELHNASKNTLLEEDIKLSSFAHLNSDGTAMTKSSHATTARLRSEILQYCPSV